MNPLFGQDWWILASLDRNDDGYGDGKKKEKKARGLDLQNNNFARAHLFLYISLPTLHDYNVKVPNFTFRRGREQQTNLFLLSWTLIQSFRIQLQKNLLTFDESNLLE